MNDVIPRVRCRSRRWASAGCATHVARLSQRVRGCFLPERDGRQVMESWSRYIVAGRR